MLKVNLIVLLVLCLIINFSSGHQCVPNIRNPQDCVCNSTYCDMTPPIEWCRKDTSSLSLYVTSLNGDRINKKDAKFEDADFNNRKADFVLEVNPCKTYQKITGFGGALTDAAVKVISSLSDKAKLNLMKSYFDDDIGIGYNYLRVPFGSSDASERNYTYDDEQVADPMLSNFSLANEDKNLKIPLIRQAQDISSRPVLLVGANWYAPKWMTVQVDDNNTRSIINPNYYEAWSNYHLKVLEKYQDEGINFTYLSPANEPLMAAYSIQWTLLDYQFWFNNYLCPLIKNSTFQDIQFLLMDDKTAFLPFWQTALFDPVTYECAAGFATQWYSDPPELAIELIQETYCWLFPHKELQSTEASICQFEKDYNMTSDFDKAVRYASNIITKLNSCTTAFLDYNIALDPSGGPSFQDNFCYSAITVNSTSDEFYKKPLFYVLGHFSKFILPGSVRTNVLMYPSMDDVSYVAFETSSNCTQNNLVVVILNTNDKDYKANLCYNKNKCAPITVPKNSIISTVSTIPSDVKC